MRWCWKPPGGCTVTPDKEYTAFTKVPTDSGEIVVTGRVFESGDWVKPSHQYCYLEISGLGGRLADR